MKFEINLEAHKKMIIEKTKMMEPIWKHIEKNDRRQPTLIMVQRYIIKQIQLAFAF